MKFEENENEASIKTRRGKQGDEDENMEPNKNSSLEQAKAKKVFVFKTLTEMNKKNQGNMFTSAQLWETIQNSSSGTY